MHGVRSVGHTLSGRVGIGQLQRRVCSMAKRTLRTLVTQTFKQLILIQRDGVFHHVSFPLLATCPQCYGYRGFTNLDGQLQTDPYVATLLALVQYGHRLAVWSGYPLSPADEPYPCTCLTDMQHGEEKKSDVTVSTHSRTRTVSRAEEAKRSIRRLRRGRTRTVRRTLSTTVAVASSQRSADASSETGPTRNAE